jgi:hypothetical protein
MNAYFTRAVAALVSVVVTLTLFNSVAWLADPVVAGNARSFAPALFANAASTHSSGR